MNSKQRAELLRVAATVLDAAAGPFRDGLGAASAVTKGNNDFATSVDLRLEREIGTELTARTGIGVHGEEFGGPSPAEGTVWVLDPIDGTFNYSAGLEMCGILLALLEDGMPIIGLTWLPLLNRRYAATVDGPVLADGEPLPALAPVRLATAMVGYGTLDTTHGSSVDDDTRLALVSALNARSARVRLLGSTGVDLALTAAGVLGGTVVFGHNPWDNAAGVALVRAAGGVVTDFAGKPWTLDSDAILAAAPGIHSEMLELVREAGRGEAV